MNAYKCDICKSFFEDEKQDVHTTGPKKMLGHYSLELVFERVNKVPSISMFRGDICPNCYGLLCEQMVARGCTDEYVTLDAKAHRNEVSEALKTDASFMEYFRTYNGRLMGYYDDLIEYLSQFDESDTVKVKYIRKMIEGAIGQSVDWYERRKT